MDLGAVIAGLDLLVVVGETLPEEFAGGCVIHHGANVGLTGDEFEFAVAVQVRTKRAESM